METSKQEATGLVFGGTHYDGHGSSEFVEVLGGPVTVEDFAEAVRWRHTVSHGRAIDLQDGTLLLACCGDCVEAALRAAWCFTVPEWTRVTVDSWPAVGEECHGCGTVAR